MTVTALLTLPCTITRRAYTGATDRYGSPTPTETHTDALCELQQRQRTEHEDEGETIDGTWLLVLPAGTLIGPSDSVSVQGSGDFDVHGEPWPVRNPRTGAPSHIEATLRRAGGTAQAGAS